MRLTTFVALTGLLTCGALTGRAQARASSEAATAEQRLAEDVGLERLPYAFPATTAFRNVAVLQQSGSNNTATISQQNPTLTPNEAIVVQAGANNVLGMSQLGGNNRVAATQTGNNNATGYTQNGTNNSTTIIQNGFQNRIQGVADGSDFLLDGSNNTMKITQQGDNNAVKGEVHENGRTYDIRQLGNNNTLTQIESTMQTPKGYSVEMRGQGINLTIEQSKVVPGVK